MDKKVKLLILTQKVDINDDILGFFHGWIEEFARQCESVIVICLQKGEYSLPQNVKVLSLGKEEFIRYSHHSYVIRILASLSCRFVSLYRFYKYIWQERRNYDAVFVHMNKEYVALGGWAWKLFGKKVGFWHTHRQVDLKLRVAERFSDVIFTASKESFQLASEKVMATGHGIDTEKFKIEDKEQADKPNFKVIYVGRISRLKNQELLIRAANILINGDKLERIEFELVGGAITYDDMVYQEKIIRLIRQFNLENFFYLAGSVSNKNILNYYRKAAVSINLCPTGGMDKVVLESMACGVPAIAYNKTFLNAMGKYKDKLILLKADEAELAQKIKQIILLPEEERVLIGRALRQVVVANHNLENLIIKIVNKLK